MALCLGDRRTGFDILFAGATLLLVFVTPLSIAFTAKPHPAIVYIASACDALFLVEYLMILIRTRHARKSWRTRFLELLIALPLSLLHGVPLNLQVIKLLRVVRVTKLQRLCYVAQYRFRLRNATIRIGVGLLLLGASLHFCSCFLIFNTELDADDSWVVRLVGGAPPEPLSRLELYRLAFYASVTVLSSVGFGDASPTTRAEMDAFIALIFIGSSVYIFLLSFVSNLLFSAPPKCARLKIKTYVARSPNKHPSSIARCAPSGEAPCTPHSLVKMCDAQVRDPFALSSQKNSKLQ